jgi:hypothetical protein
MQPSSSSSDMHCRVTCNTPRRSGTAPVRAIERSVGVEAVSGSTLRMKTPRFAWQCFRYDKHSRVSQTLPLSQGTIAAPEPPRRPPELGAPPSDGKAAHPAADAKPDEGPVVAAEFAECIVRLQRMGLIAEIAITPDNTNAACMIENPVRLASLKVSGEQHPVGFPDRPILACRFAERLGEWVGEVAAPLIAARLAPLRSVRTGPGYDCRNRNRALAGKLSAHAVGHAVDIEAFTVGAGEALSITEVDDERKKRVLATLRTAACGWFTTILGPGSDPAHATHWHFDIEKHGSSNNYRICGSSK